MTDPHQFAGRRRPQAVPATPPPDVARAVECAAGVYERLAAQGCAIRFKANALTRRAVVQLQECGCHEVRSIDPSELFGLLSQGD
jgi:hypothetical protein